MLTEAWNISCRSSRGHKSHLYHQSLSKWLTCHVLPLQLTDFNTGFFSHSVFWKASLQKQRQRFLLETSAWTRCKWTRSWGKRGRAQSVTFPALSLAQRIHFQLSPQMEAFPVEAASLTAGIGRLDVSKHTYQAIQQIDCALLPRLTRPRTHSSWNREDVCVRETTATPSVGTGALWSHSRTSRAGRVRCETPSLWQYSCIFLSVLLRTGQCRTRF